MNPEFVGIQQVVRFEFHNCLILELLNLSMLYLCYNIVIRPPDKSVYLKIILLILLISQPKHMLWVLKRTVSMRRFF